MPERISLNSEENQLAKIIDNKAEEKIPEVLDVKKKQEFYKKTIEEQKKTQKWRHPGGKLRELGAGKLSDVELLAILISTGIKGKSAEQIAQEILCKYDSFRGLANQPLEKLLKIKGLGDVKIIRVAAAFEIAKRIIEEIKNNEK